MGVEEVVGDRPDPRPTQVPEYREVRHQEQHDEQKPALPLEAIEQDAQGQHDGSFDPHEGGGRARFTMLQILLRSRQCYTKDCVH